MKRFTSSITLVITGVIYIILIIPRTCDGGTSDFFCPALTLIFIINLLFIILTGYFRWHQRKTRFDNTPVFVALILFAIVASIKVFTSESFKDRMIINAFAREPDSARVVEITKKSLGYRLILRDNNNYHIISLLPEMSCTYAGKFSTNHDTVDLQESFILYSDTNLARRYFIDRNTKFLKPLDPMTNRIAYSKWWFEIIEMQSPEY
jgi:hypothetical protein